MEVRSIVKTMTLALGLLCGQAILAADETPRTPLVNSEAEARMDAVITRNGPISYAPVIPCYRDIVCLSGMMNLEARYYDRLGDAFTPGVASFAGAGARPLFGPPRGTIVGSINNANLFLDTRITNLIKLHMGLAYINGSVTSHTYAIDAADWGSVNRNTSGLKVDEAYVTFADAKRWPVFVKIGRMYLDFGDYKPYGINTFVPTLTNLMTQIRTGGAQIGFAMRNGFYATATWSMAEQSLDNFSGRTSPFFPFNAFGHHDRNYSAKVGYAQQFYDTHANVNVSWIKDIRDADYFNDTLNNLNTIADPSGISGGLAPDFTMRLQHGAAFHADIKNGAVSLGLEGATALGNLSLTNPDGRLYTAGIDGDIAFTTWIWNSDFDLGYQMARNTNVVDGTGFVSFPIAGTPPIQFPFGPFYDLLPKYRIVGTYTVRPIEHASVSLQWVHDQDFAQGQHHGVGHGSNLAVARIGVQF